MVTLLGIEPVQVEGIATDGLSERTDEGVLAAGFVARRNEAFANACEAYAGELCSVAHHVLRDRSRAEDCVHDALLRIWRSPGAYHPDRGSLRAFLIVSVRNAALDELRAITARAEFAARSHALDAPAREVRLVDPADAARVRDAIAALPEEQRDVVLRAYYRNRSLAQIADETQTPAEVLSSRAAGAVARLSTDLERAYGR